MGYVRHLLRCGHAAIDYAAKRTEQRGGIVHWPFARVRHAANRACAEYRAGAMKLQCVLEYMAK